jgi:hypothetical protein
VVISQNEIPCSDIAAHFVTTKDIGITSKGPLGILCKMLLEELISEFNLLANRHYNEYSSLRRFFFHYLLKRDKI